MINPGEIFIVFNKYSACKNFKARVSYSEYYKGENTY